MKNIFCSAICLVIVIGAVSAQEITMYKTFGGVRFERDSVALSQRQVMEILHENPAASTEFKKAKTNSTVSAILGFSGGVLLGFPLGTAVAGGDPEWNLAIAGGVLILGSIPFNRMYKARALTALDIYNGKKVTGRVRPEFYFYGTSARLILKF